VSRVKRYFGHCLNITALSLSAVLAIVVLTVTPASAFAKDGASSSCVAFIDGALISKKSAVVELENALPAHVDPANVVDGVTVSLLSYVREKDELFSSDLDQYYEGIKGLLDPAVDFLRIAKNVMGKKNWLAATEEQREQFVVSFNDYLVRFYGKNLKPYVDSEVDLESSCLRQGSKSVYVQQRVKTASGMNRLVYTMRKNEAGWMLSNVQFNGVNMGQTFRSQFQQLVNDNGGDVGLAVEKWTLDQG